MSGKYCTYQDIKGIYSDYDDCGYYIGDTGKFYDSPGKKVKNIYHLLCSNENLCKAQYNAQKGKGDRTEIRNFNPMFETARGVVDENQNKIYLRPETAQGEYVNFLNIQRSM